MDSSNNIAFVFFSYGNKIIHNRTIFCIYSLLSHYKLKENDKILIYTDTKDYLSEFLSDEYKIEYNIMSKETLDNMQNGIGLIHRVKICIIKETMLQYPKHNIFYMDSDTFVKESIDKTISSIAPINSIMHTFEFNFKELIGKGVRDISHTFFEVFYQTIQEDINSQQDIHTINSYNAGIIGLHHSNIDALEKVFLLTDKTYPQINHHAAEQFSFSYILSTIGNVSFCEKQITHYWKSIEKSIMDIFIADLLNKKFKELSNDVKLSKIKMLIKTLDKHIANHPLMLRDNAIQAFNKNKYREGLLFAIRYLANKPNDIAFIKDVLYHTKKKIF